MPGCKRQNAVLCERTNPRDYSVERLLLCAPCRTKLGISPTANAAVSRQYAIRLKGE